ncbi:8-oxo-dGTP diphosphatase [Flavobacteriaceae bacterium UJ101]|nr:8-oxo-dGTP diphosphatase [Flavobacteriaceae bacterium UJ101]
MNTNPKVKIGVGVLIKKGNKVLIGKRTGSHGENTWSFPGGHLEFGETEFETATREVKEETDLNIENLQKYGYTNDFFEEENKHYITLFVKADWKSGEPKRMEPEKCSEWRWERLDNLPKPLFLPIENLLKQS